MASKPSPDRSLIAWINALQPAHGRVTSLDDLNDGLILQDALVRMPVCSPLSMVSAQ